MPQNDISMSPALTTGQDLGSVAPTIPVPASAPGPIPSTGAGKVSVQLATLFYGKLVTYERHRLQKLLPSLLGSRELVVPPRRPNTLAGADRRLRQ